MPTVLEPLQIIPGVEPSTDKPETTTQHYTDMKHIRFVDSFPQKIGGWESITYTNNETITGTARTIFSYTLKGFERYLIGTNSKLYDVFAGVLTNITPQTTTTTSVANNLDTYYDTLGNNPINTVSGSTAIVINDTAHKFRAGDSVTLSGSTNVNGVPSTEINKEHFIRSVTTNTYTVNVSTAATSTGSGGGASVIRSSGIITVNSTAHGLNDGQRVGIQNSTDVGGITALEINKEFIIFNATSDAFDVFTDDLATSSVTGGGGASAEYTEEIASGNVDTLQSQGYGAGLYGTGRYGVSKSSSSTEGPRIWSHDLFGNLTISCAGQEGNIYEWDGDTANSPVDVSNAPTANYVFTTDNFIVALGYDFGSAQTDNGIAWCDQGDRTNWTTGQSGNDAIEGAGEFISHASARGENLLFTRNQTYIFRFIGGQFIFQTSQLDPNVGVIAQNARTTALGTVYWMGQNNFYMWRGGSVEVIPSNTSTESTALSYVFDDFNFGQKQKVFCWYNQQFQEVWWHYPSSNSNEPDRVIRLDIKDFTWEIDEFDRTAAEYPAVLTDNPTLINVGTPYLHESGLNDDGSGMQWRLQTNFEFGGSDTTEITAFVPDYNMSGNMDVQLTTREYANSPNTQVKTYSVDQNTGRVETQQNGRYWQFLLSGSELDQQLNLGQWYKEVKRSSPKQ